jgi:predicted AlkP superfamily phosphohydrolase/phosphomutase
MRGLQLTEKMLVIGLDGATFSIIKPLVDGGKLPTFQRLLKHGANGVLESTPDTNSPCAWSTFITGKNPGEHGIFGFFENLPNSYEIRFLNGSFRNGKSLWRILSEHGKKVGVINVPFSYPVEEVNGFIIAGPDSPGKNDRGFAYPDGIIREIETHTGDYMIEAGASALVRRGNVAEALYSIQRCIRARAAAARYLLKKDDYNFFMVVFTETDRVQHHFWKYINPSHPAYSSPEKERYRNAIYQTYETLDGVVAELIDAAGPDYAVIIMSDHGAGPSSSKTFYINRWLRNAGYLNMKSRGSLQHYVRESLEKVIGHAYLFAKSNLKRPWKRRLRNLMPNLKNRASSVLRGLRIDWVNTKAFSWENAPTIYFNVKDKFPRGNLEPGEDYDRLREELMERLLNLRDPHSGEKMVESVRKREELYWGPYLHKAPDLFIQLKENQYTVRPSYISRGHHFVEHVENERLSKLETVSRPSGVHKRDGVFIFSSPNVSQGRMIEGLRLYDVTATILYYLGVPIPRDFDGAVRQELFTDEFRKDHAVRFSESDSQMRTYDRSYTREQAKMIAERLQGLGYME